MMYAIQCNTKPDMWEICEESGGDDGTSIMPAIYHSLEDASRHRSTFQYNWPSFPFRIVEVVNIVVKEPK